MKLTAEQLKQITESVSQAILGSDSIGKVIGEFVRKIVPGIVEANLKGAIDPIKESIEGITKALEEKPNDPPKDPDKPNDADPSPEILKLQRELKETREAVQRSEAERAKEREAASEARRRAAFLEAAQKVELVGAEYVYAKHRDQIEETEDGRHVIKIQRETGGQKYTEDVLLSDWIEKDFLDSEEGKQFAPAKGAGGSGGRPGDNAPGGRGTPTRDQLVDMAVFGEVSQ